MLADGSVFCLWYREDLLKIDLQFFRVLQSPKQSSPVALVSWKGAALQRDSELAYFIVGRCG